MVPTELKERQARTTAKAAQKSRKGLREMLAALKVATLLAKPACDFVKALNIDPNLAAKYCDLVNFIITVLNVLSALSVLIEYSRSRKQIQS